MSLDHEDQPLAGLTRELAGISSALAYEALPEDVVQIARQCLLDWFAVTLGGSGEEAPRILLATLAGEDAHDGGVSVVGRRLRLAPLRAALVNGTASHVLDFDDVNLAFLGHASVAVGAAALALAEELDADCGELVAAFVAGYETACGVAAAVGPQPYLRGFHATGTLGTFGAAAACARLLGLGPAQTAVAFGLAASQAAGAKANLGTMTKSLHAGKACENGLLSALLAARGFTANADAIEAEQGFAAIVGGGCDAEAALGDPPDGWHIRGNLFKYHAACYFTHSMLEGIGELRRSGRVSAEDIESVTVHVGEIELGAASIASPADGLQVKFSLAHLAALALLDRSTAAIPDEYAHDPQALELRCRVQLADDGRPGAPTLVQVRLGDGTVAEAAVDVATPEHDLALQSRRLTAKFATLAEPVLGPDAAGTLLAALGELHPGLAVRSLMALATPPRERAHRREQAAPHSKRS
ncbi:MAG TPA: MmgE/PrpD family protein [Solirubrobacteraceae bacterium]|nr:MmgE/PrpD family protein [Solirubrobacteraceae bacterium]